MPGHLSVNDVPYFFRRLAIGNGWINSDFGNFPMRDEYYKKQAITEAGTEVIIRGGWHIYTNEEMLGALGVAPVGKGVLDEGMCFGGREIHVLATVAGHQEREVVGVIHQPIVLRGLLPDPDFITGFDTVVQVGTNFVTNLDTPIEQDDIVSEGLRNAQQLLTA